MKYTYKHQTGGYGGCLLWIVILIMLWACSCSKSSAQLRPPTRIKYQCIVDRYDTTMSTLELRTLFYQDYFTPEENHWGMDTIPDKLYKICEINKMEYLYYTIDDKKLFNSCKVGDKKPLKTDTTWVNYHK